MLHYQMLNPAPNENTRLGLPAGEALLFYCTLNALRAYCDQPGKNARRIARFQWRVGDVENECSRRGRLMETKVASHEIPEE